MSKYAIGNDGFHQLLAEISAATNEDKIIAIVEFSQNKFDSNTEDAKVACVFKDGPTFLKIPAGLKRTAYKTSLNREDTADWSIFVYDNGEVRENINATSFVHRDEMDGQFGKWYKYSFVF